MPTWLDYHISAGDDGIIKLGSAPLTPDIDLRDYPPNNWGQTTFYVGEIIGG